MTWQEQAEYVLGEIQYDLDNPGHLDAAYIRSYIIESAERIAMLEAALAFLADGVQVRQVLVSTYANGIRYEPGEQVFMRHGRILGMASECPELAQYLRERDDHIVGVHDMVGEDQK